MADLASNPTGALRRDAGWPALFWEAFTRSRNPMVLVDAHRVTVEVNAAYLSLVGYPRRQLIGRRFYELVAGGPLVTEAEWKEIIERRQFTGVAELLCSDGARVKVEYAGRPEVVTGRRLVLFVALRTARGLRRLGHEPAVSATETRITERELDVVGLIALGLSGPEIAEEMHLAHDTVRTHTRNVMGKLGARSRAQLVAMLVGTGMVRLPVAAGGG